MFLGVCWGRKKKISQVWGSSLVLIEEAKARPWLCFGAGPCLKLTGVCGSQTSKQEGPIMLQSDKNTDFSLQVQHGQQAEPAAVLCAV